MKTLLIGIGNPGRRDDGLGPALVERVAAVRPPERAVVSLEEAAHPGSPNERFPASAGTIGLFWAYQLNIEDAATVRDYDRVIFADAMRSDPEVENFSSSSPGPSEKTLKLAEAPAIPDDSSSHPGAVLEPITPAASIAFTTHEMSPASVLALAEELYGKAPAGFLLKIRGAEWDFAEGLSPAGEQNLAEAERLFQEFSSH